MLQNTSNDISVFVKKRIFKSSQIFLFSLVDFQSLDIPHILALKFTNSYLLTYLVIYLLKGTVSVISSDLLSKDENT